MSPSTGELLGGRYRLIAMLGQGGMGIVYRAYDETANRSVAVKVIRPGFASSPDYRERFRTETTAAREIDHPNVIPIHDVGYGEDLYIVMRLVAGADLGQRLKMVGRIPLSQTLQIGNQIASALEAIHAAGLVHRDIKPDNVLLAPTHGRDHAYLTDFGIARSAPADLRSSSFGGLVGSLPYCSPERFQGESGGPSSDVYGLACLAVECLTGRVPFPGPEYADYLRQHEGTPPPPLAELADGLPPELDPVIARALEKDPEQRQASPQVWMSDLQAAAAGAGEVPAWTGTAVSSEPSPPSPPSPPSSGDAGEPAAEGEESALDGEPPPAAAAEPVVEADDEGAPSERGRSRAKVVALSAAIVGFLAVATVAGIAISDSGDTKPAAVASHAATPSHAASASTVARLVGAHTAADAALFHRVATLPLGPCAATAETTPPAGQTAALTCKPGVSAVDSVTIRQFSSSNAAIRDAAKRPVNEGVTTTYYTCDPNGTPPNNGQIAAYGNWSHDGRQGYLQCYAQARSGGRALVWTYDSQAIEMAAVKATDDSPQAAIALFDWWDRYVHTTALAPKV